MAPFRMRFIIGKLTDEELNSLKKGETVISKMILIPDDYRLFHYKVGDDIEVETHDGDRIWASIQGMEIVEDAEQIIIIFSLVTSKQNENPGKKDAPVR